MVISTTSMRIYLTSHHAYPARIRGVAGCRVIDNIAKGLAELGHETYYHLGGGRTEALPQGVRPADGPMLHVDVWHVQDTNPNGKVEGGVPWVRTYHSNEPLATTAPDRWQANNWIFVSRSHAKANGRTRFVYNGIDPQELIYSESKDEYFLFAISHLSRAESKGVAIAIQLQKQCGFRLVIAGGTDDEVAEWRRNYTSTGIEFTGWIQGCRRAELFAGARALLFPTQLDETFGLVVAEAMMSGTPVIASNRGACPELITDDTGFVCAEMGDYLRAVDGVGRISTKACRDRAMAEFHYLKMARNYVDQYLVQMTGGPAE
jgi:glycosyltransferase involved in cell wall biosynthesis